MAQAQHQPFEAQYLQQTQNGRDGIPSCRATDVLSGGKDANAAAML